MRAILGLKWDVLIIVILSLGLGLYAFEWEPYWIADNSAIERGSRPPDRAEGDVLLILPDTPSDNAREFEELDTSYAWYNALWQKFGSFASTKLRNLSPELLAGRAAVIVPSQVARQMPQNGFQALRGFVEQGGVLIVEMPSNDWTALTQLTSTGKSRGASYAKLDVDGNTIEVPLVGVRLPVSAASFGTDRVALSVDDKPGVIRTSVGRGVVVAVAFEFGRSVIALQQGKPNTGMAFESKTIGSRSIIPEKFRNAPVADLLEEAVLSAVAESRPVPSLWRFPESYRGATLLIHPAYESSPTVRMLSEKSVGSVLLPPSLDWGKTYGCVWSDQRLDAFAIAERIAGVLPARRQLAVNDQITEHCIATIPHRHIWERGWSTSLRALAATHSKIDFSYAPTQTEMGGFAFGTGYPFYPIDLGGLPLPVLQMPVLMTEYHAHQFDGLQGETFGYHSAVTVEIPADGMKTNPTAAQMFALSEIELGSVESNTWFVTPSDFLHFVSARRQTVMTSQWFDSDNRLVISLDVMKALDVPAPSVAIPDRGIFTIVVDGEALALDDVETIEGNRIVGLEPGRHTIEVLYQSSELPPAPNPDLD